MSGRARSGRASTSRGASELSDLLAFARQRLHMELLVMADDGSPDGQWTCVSSALWPSGDEPEADEDYSLEQTFDRYLLDVRLGRLDPPGHRHAPVSEVAPRLGTVIRVPLLRRDGEPFGALIALPQDPTQALSHHEADAVESFAQLLTDFIRAAEDGWTGPVAARKILRRLTDAGGPAAYFQSIHELDSGRSVGYEALARFPENSPPPADWFEAADLAGRRVELETAAIQAALKHQPHLGARLSVNVSEETLLDPSFRLLFDAVSTPGLVLELTEQHSIQDYSAVNDALRGLRADGMLLAIDDVGSGYSSLRHVLALNPEIMKLDISLVRGIDAHTQQQAMVRSLNAFATETGIFLVAEGVETAAERDVLLQLGITHAQGFYMSRPRPCPSHGSAPPLPVLVAE